MMKVLISKGGIYVLLFFSLYLIDCANSNRFRFFKESKYYFSKPGNNRHLMQIEVIGCYKILAKDTVLTMFDNLNYTKDELTKISCFLSFNGIILNEYVTSFAEQEILKRSFINLDGSVNDCIDTNKRIKRYFNDSSKFILAVKNKNIIKDFDKICNNNKKDTFLISWAGNYSTESGKAIRVIPESEMYYGNIDTSTFKELHFYDIKDSCR